MENLNNQQLNNLYYNLGLRLGGTRTVRPTQYLSDNYETPLSEEELIKAGQGFASGSQFSQKWGGSQSMYENLLPNMEQEYQSQIDQANRQVDYLNNREWKTSNKDQSILNAGKNLQKAQSNLGLFNYFRDSKKLLEGGGSIARETMPTTPTPTLSSNRTSSAQVQPISQGQTATQTTGTTPSKYFSTMSDYFNKKKKFN